MLVQDLQQKGLIKPPKWLAANTVYLVTVGSNAYGMSGDTSDMDVYGIAFAPKEVTFPHLAGEIPGFGRNVSEPWGQWSEHHIRDGDREFDFTVYNIVKWFQMGLKSTPNVLDALFAPQRCVLHCTAVGQMIRDRRRLFLSKEVYPKLRGYAFSQLKKVKEKQGSANAKRAANIENYGFDVKAASHIVRLLLQCEQILTQGDLDLERNSEVLKSVRRGEWTFERIETYFESKEAMLDSLFASCSLPALVPEDEAKGLLMECLEHHYGNIDKAVVRQTDAAKILAEMQAVIDRHKGYA